MPSSDMPTDMGKILKRPEAVQAALEKLAHDCPTECQLSCAVDTGLRLPEHWFLEAVGALVKNAVDAAPSPGGRIRLDAARAVLTEPQQLRFGHALAAGTYLTVSVGDNGPGVSTEALARGVEPGYSSKPGRKGMGLSSAYGIAVSCQGGLDLINLPGGGAVATIYFKAASPA